MQSQKPNPKISSQRFLSFRIGAVVLAVVCLAVISNISVASAAITGTSPNLTGDTIITDHTIWQSEIITLAGNVFISDNGILEIDNTTLKFNNSYICEYWMELTNSGKLIVKNNSVVGAIDTTNGVTIMLLDNSIIEANDSTFTGLDGDPKYASTAKHGGIVLYGGGTSGIFNNLTFEDCEKAINSYITDLNIENCDFYRIGNLRGSVAVTPNQQP